MASGSLKLGTWLAAWALALACSRVDQDSQAEPNAAGTSATVAAAVTCAYEGKTYAAGDTFQSECRSCSCNADGSVACDAGACPTCLDVVQEYNAIFEAARRCDPTAEQPCSLQVIEGPECECPTFVNPANYDAAAVSNAASSYAQVCGPRINCEPCPEPQSALCTPNGFCIDDTTLAQQAACVVGGVIYQSGAGDIADPFSCNRCICYDGKLACDDRDCPAPCATGTAPATSCSKCGGSVCEAVEIGCLPACTDTCESGVCKDGVCQQVCLPQRKH